MECKTTSTQCILEMSVDTRSLNYWRYSAEGFFFFHPPVWYASFQLTRQQEQICDNYVIEKGVRVMDYSKFLSRIAEQRFEKQSSKPGSRNPVFFLRASNKMQPFQYPCIIYNR